MKLIRKNKFLIAILAIMLILSSSIIVFAAQEVIYTTNGAAEKYSPGSVLVLYGKVSDNSIPISNLAITVDIKDTSSKAIYFGQIKTDTAGYFKTNFTVPTGVSGVMKVRISTNSGEVVNANYSLENNAGFLFTGTIPALGTSESSSLTIPYSTDKIGLAFSSNVNYFNNKNSSLNLTNLGVNTRNEDCFTLLEKTPTGYKAVGSQVELTTANSTVFGINFFDEVALSNRKSETKNVIYLRPDSALKQNTSYKIVMDKDLTANNSSTLGVNKEVFFTTSFDKNSGSGTTTTPENTIDISVKPIVVGDKATVKVSDMQLEEALKNVKESENNIAQLTVSPADTASVTDFVFHFSRVQISELRSATVGVALNTPSGEVIFPRAVIEQIKGDVTVEVSRVEERADTFRITLTDGSGKVKSLNGRTGFVFPTNTAGTASNIMTHDGVIMKNAVIKNKKATGIIRGFSEFAVKDNLIEFADIKGHWAKDYITFLSSREIVNGVSKDQFAPSNNVTRAEFVKMLANSMDEILIDKAKSSNFSDVLLGQWYSDYIMWSADNKIVNGYGDGTFGLNKPITRQEMAVIIDRFATKMEIPLDSTISKKTFTDNLKIADYANTSVYKMQQAGLISGKQNNLFDPTGNATRAEASKMITILIEKLVGAN